MDDTAAVPSEDVIPVPGEGDRAASDATDVEILDGLQIVFTALVAHVEYIAREFSVPAFFLKALHLLDSPMAMKDLGRRMHCDPSFVTGIADMMEKRGLAARVSDPADRRVKRLALTPAGLQLKQQMEQKVLAGAPWRRALDDGERACLLGILRKIVPAVGAEPSPLADLARSHHRGEVSDLTAPSHGAHTLTGH